jgi:general secretion pathway protein B
MSYILDAIRKSEHERQIVAGQNIGMLYPIEVKRNNKPWLIPTVLGLAALIVLALTWRLNSRPTEVIPSLASDDKKPAISTPQAVPEKLIPAPELAASPKKHVSEKIRAEAEPVFKLKKSVPKNEPKSLPVSPIAETQHASPPLTKTKSNTPSGNVKSETVDPLKGLPTINITGYVHNSQTGNLVMINNQLVHEGDEISPGLRLVKILDNNAVLNYKGFVFTK